jgi:choline monooxygenase
VDTLYSDQLHERMVAERDRTRPPESFPALPDIPLARYTDNEFYQAEIDRLFKRSWLFVGHESQWPKPGSYITPPIPFAPVVVTRGKDGVLRAFLNACRHRGAPVVREEQGCSRLLVCQYHSWAYDLTGNLVNVTQRDDFLDLDTEKRSLVSVRCESWGGLVFVNLDPHAPSLAEWLGVIGDVHGDVAHAPNLRLVGTSTWEPNCNWKVAVDAFLEDYHVTTIHPQTLTPMLDLKGSVVELYPHGHTGTFIPYREEVKGQVIWGADLQKMAVHNIYDTDLQSFSLFPNLLTGSDDASGFFVATWWPMGIARTRMDVTWYGVDWGDEPRPEGWDIKLTGSNYLMEEDLRNLEPIQRSLEVAAHSGVPLSYLERRIWHFHAQIDKTIGADAIRPELRVPDLLDNQVYRASESVTV